MAYPLRPPIKPMLSKLQEAIPQGEGWLYEPKWDGFRAIVFRDGERIHISSRKLLPLERYFPELIDPLKAALPERCVIDGEIILVTKRGLDFDSLQLRLHPAESRIRKLAQETPTTYVAFDVLAVDSKDVRKSPFIERRRLLEKEVEEDESILITPQTDDPAVAELWFDAFEGAGLDGVIAKKTDLRYIPGERVMVKVKHLRTVDCVVGGYRIGKTGDGIGSLLLGLYDDSGVLHFVGHTSSFSAPERRRLLQMLQGLGKGTSFGRGRTPGEPSRWTQGKDMTWYQVKPKLVCEVAFDYLQGDRFRHASKFLRWREDKKPKECTFDQLIPPVPFSLDKVKAAAKKKATASKGRRKK